MVNSPLLDYQYDYWKRFINADGSVNEADLYAAGYDGANQIDWLRAEMAERGWLVKADAPVVPVVVKGKSGKPGVVVDGGVLKRANK